DAGHYRSTGVGVFAGKELIHMAPPADLVPGHIDNLLKWLESSDDHPLIKSCVFHYEFEFIHPFSDGNGRTGRLWQTVILSNWKPIFQWVPVESLVYSNRDSYYKAIGDSTDLADSSPFIDLMLTMIRDAMLTVVDRSMVCETGDDGLTQGHRMILELIDSGKLTSIRDAYTTLDFTESAVRRYLDELKEMGLIRRVGSRKTGHWERV
ncbi:Fic family protein, partial [Candidatus Methanarcanum hacksteinii]|uniref:Fic family protein n=1 Tax=Candidatus Methanarcanum hacksteinii TaxID=2911857 RepID=UPI0037DCFB16